MMHALPSLVLVLYAQANPAEVPPAAIARTFAGHQADVYDVAFSPDGKLLATASFDKTVKLWNVENGTEIATLSGHEGKVLALAFSPNGRLLVTGGGDDKTLRLWDVPAEGAAAIASHDGAVEGVLLSPDGALVLTVGADKTLRAFQRQGGKEVLKFEAAAPLAALAMDAGGRLVAAAGDDRTVRVWSIAHLTAPPPAVAAASGSVELLPQGAPWRYHKGKGEPPAEWRKAGFDDGQWTEGPSGFGYSSDAEELATVKTKLDDMPSEQYLSVYLRGSFNVDDPKKVERLSLRVTIDDGFVAYLNGDEVGRANVSGSPPAYNATAGASSEPMAVDVDLTPHAGKLVSGKNVLAVQGHNASTSSSDFVLTPVLSAAIKAAEPPKKPDEPLKLDVAAFSGSEGAVRALAFSADAGLVAAGGEDKRIRVFSLKENKEAANLDNGAVVRALAFLADGSLVSADDEGPLKVWNLAEGKVARKAEGHKGPVRALALNKDRSRLASSGDDGTVRVWEAASGKELRSIAAHEGGAQSVAFSADDKLLVSGGADKLLKVWTVEDGAEAAKFPNEGAVRAVASQGDGRYYAAAGGKALLEWRVVSPKAIQTMTGHGGYVHAVAFSPDGAQIASASSDKTVRFWNPADGKQRLSINAHDSSVYCLAFTSDGKLLASGGFDRAVKLWNVENGAEVRKLEGHGEGVFGLAFTRDGKHLFSCSSDHTIRKWDVNEGKQAAVFEGHTDWVCGLVVTSNGERLLSVGHGGQLLTWNAADGKVLARRKLDPVVFDLDLSSDAKWVATANPKKSALLVGAGE
jgi:WD40 repeat protein